MKTLALETEKEAPFYLPVKDEVELFLAAYENRLSIMLKGPTGCGKTRFVSYMAQRLSRPLITVACHDDFSASDLVDTKMALYEAKEKRIKPFSLIIQDKKNNDHQKLFGEHNYAILKKVEDLPKRLPELYRYLTT